MQTAFVVLATACMGCAMVDTSYGPVGPKRPFGYVDRVNTEGGHVLLVVGSTADQARSFWDQRARELCNGSDFTKNIFRAERPVVQTSGYATSVFNPAYGASYTVDTYGSFYMEGYLRCGASSAPVPTLSQTAATDVAVEPASPAKP